MYTIFAWLFVGAAGAFVVCYSYGFKRVVALLSSHTPALVKNDGEEKKGGKRQKAKRKANLQAGTKGETTSTQASSNEGAVSKKRKIASDPINGKVTAFTSQGQKAVIPRDEDSSMSNKEFAMQLSRAQAGTKLESGSKSGAGKPDHRAAKSAARHPVTGPVSGSMEMPAETSSTGPDADDEVTDVTDSPQLNGQSTAPTSGISDINDMLEAPAAGPKVLRLTHTGGSSATQKPKATTKQFEPVKTKKQKNAELKRQQQAEDNARSAEEHKRKGEKQMREARLAEGSSAQIKSNSFKANAWLGKKNEGEPQPQQSAPVKTVTQPLDTFDHEGRGNGTAIPPPLSNTTNGRAGTSFTNNERAPLSKEHTNGWAQEQSKISEEDQMRKVMDEEDLWTMVSTKKDKKKGKKDGDTGSETSSNAPRPVTQAKKPVTTDVNGSHALPASNRFKSMEVGAAAQGIMENDEWAA